MNSALYVPRIDEASGSGWTISRIRVTSYLYKQLTIRLALCLSLLLSCTWLSATPWTATYQASLPWRELSLRVGSNSCSMSQWRYLTISSSAAPFSFCLQCFPASVSFPMSCLFASSGQSIRASASASDLSVNIQGWFPLGLTGLISLLSKELSPYCQYYLALLLIKK